MSQTHKTIISDTSCFIILSKIGALDLLQKVYGEIIIKAKLDNIIPSIKPLLDKIKETNFRISPELELQAYKEAKEI